MIRDLPSLLAPGDLLVLNDTKVFRARLHGTISAKGGSSSNDGRAASGGDEKPIELLLVRPAHFSLSPSHWEGERSAPARASACSDPSVGGEGERQGSEWLALGKPGKRFRPGNAVMIGKLRGTVRERLADGSLRIAFDRPAAAVIAYANRVGEVPTPPYVATSVQRLADYQTTYARRVGSVAAPTAGFHLTPRLLARLRTKGVHIASVTLHVGLGTFQPIRVERIEDHVMHAEWAEVPAATMRAIAQTKTGGGRIIAVGTTTLRTLEGAAHLHAEGQKSFSPSPHRGEGERVGERRSWDTLQPFAGWINIFIVPGFRFRVADALLTNFHLQKSTLLILVSAFAAPGGRSLRGRDRILRAYRSALRRGYRFYSFGDAMLIGEFPRALTAL